MLNPKIQDAFNKQINAELYSAYFYLAMGAHFEAASFRGMAAWMRAQAREEVTHAMRFYEFINDRDGRVVLSQIDAPKAQWKSPLEVFEDAYKHEVKVTGMLNDLSSLAQSERDHVADGFLKWFLNEQVEEESTAMTIRDKLRLAGDSGAALFILDEELGRRGTTAAPATPAT
jgi:ferritin